MPVRSGRSLSGEQVAESLSRSESMASSRHGTFSTVAEAEEVRTAEHFSALAGMVRLLYFDVMRYGNLIRE